MRTHVFVCFRHGITTPMVHCHCPMYNAHPYFSLTSLGKKKCALYMAISICDPQIWELERSLKTIVLYFTREQNKAQSY